MSYLAIGTNSIIYKFESNLYKKFISEFEYYYSEIIVHFEYILMK